MGKGENVLGGLTSGIIVPRLLYRHGTAITRVITDC